MKKYYEKITSFLLPILILMVAGFVICWVYFVKPTRNENSQLRNQIQSINEVKDQLDTLKK